MNDFETRQGRWPVIAVFLVLAIALAAAAWQWIGAVNLEGGDFAANSLLIQDAKKLQLVHGNYSRVGFNHPGPAILYALAAGELVFHDVLHLVPSPFSGQLLAVCVYNAAWLALIFAMLRKMAGGVAPALLFVSVAMLVSTYFDYQLFTGIWFPQLYYLPFAAALVALARLADGEADMLHVLAVATGFLINGHVSFVATLGVMLVVVLFANAAVTLREPALRVLSPRFVRTHWRALLAACGILFLFLVPLMIATLTDEVGPVTLYRKFKDASHGNTLAQALEYVAVYWGGGVGMAWGMLLVLLMLKGLPGVPVRLSRQFAIVFLAATAGLLYYAKVGIDQLAQQYIGMFYWAVPALAAALLVLALLGGVRRGRPAVAASLLALAGVALTWQMAHRLPTYARHFHLAGVQQLYEQLRAVPGTGRIVLDLDRSGFDGGEVWSNALGLQAYAARRDPGLFCLNLEWHVSNTPAARCRPEELATPRRYVVRGAESLAHGEADFVGIGLAFHRVGGPPVPSRYLAGKTDPEALGALLGEGWSDLGAGYAWTIGPVAHLRLPADARRGDSVTLDMSAFVPVAEVRHQLRAYVNGRPAGSWEFTAEQLRKLVRLDLGAGGAGPQDIELRIADPKSPKDLGLSQDDRKLGVSLYAIRIREQP